MAPKPKKQDPFFSQRKKFRDEVYDEAVALRGVESIYTNLQSIFVEMGTAGKERLKQLKEEASVYKKTAKLQEDVAKKTFQRQNLEDRIFDAIAKGNDEELKRLRNADAFNAKLERQNDLIGKQAGIVRGIGDMIDKMAQSVPGGSMLAALLGISGLGDDLESGFRQAMQAAGTLDAEGNRRGFGDEFKGAMMANLVSRFGSGVDPLDEAKEGGLPTGNLNRFIRSMGVKALVGAGALTAAFVATKNLRVGMEKGLGLDATGGGRGFLQNLIFGSTADAFEDEFGQITQLSNKQALEFRKMQTFMGLSAENAAKLSKELIISSDLTMDQTDDVLKTVQGLAKAANVAPKAIFEDMAQNSDLFAQFAQDGAGGLAEAAIKAKTLGLNLSAVSSVAKSLLDFETSISNEFEAQVLTGKMINLDRARGLALQGKASELLDEIVKQVGGEAELRSMNILQMESLAGAVGLSVSQLQRVVQGNEAALKNPVVSKLDETNEILRAQLDTEQRQLLGQQQQDTMVTYG